MQFVIRRLVGLAIVFTVFGVLEALFTHRRDQRRFRQGFGTDLVHLLVTPALGQAAGILLLLPVILGVWLFTPEALQEWVAALPGWQQFVLALTLSDLCGYGYHRAAHSVPFLWKLHAVHHSSEEMDWLASARLHPLDRALGTLVRATPLLVLGFSRETFGAYLAVTPALGLLLHANIDVPLGPLRYVFMNPEHHHWHHAADRRVNFAGQLPVWDWLFGTLYLPGELPQRYGCNAPVPAGWWRQMWFPFLGGAASEAAGVAAEPLVSGPPRTALPAGGKIS